jgi:hypothetical protein
LSDRGDTTAPACLIRTGEMVGDRLVSDSAVNGPYYNLRVVRFAAFLKELAIIVSG